MPLFLCVADTHGFLPQECLEVGRRPDALLLLGDLEHAISKVLDRFPGVPAFGVAGNHDSDEPFAGTPAIDLHGRAVSWNGLVVAGLGGCLRYKPGSSRWLFWEREYAEILVRMPRADLFLSHCAPFGCWPEPPRTVDDGFYNAHGGSKALRDYIICKQPGLVLHGHLYVPGLAFLGGTPVRAVYLVELVTFEP